MYNHRSSGLFPDPNPLHWVLDMSFNDDYSRILKGNGPFAMMIIQHIALNLLRLHKTKRQSIKGLRKICACDDKELSKVVAKLSAIFKLSTCFSAI